jgi:hypothetical protein
VIAFLLWAGATSAALHLGMALTVELSADRSVRVPDSDVFGRSSDGNSTRVIPAASEQNR